MKKYRYKTLKIDRLALVPKGAMGVEGLYKAEDGSFNKVEKLFKFDDSERILKTIVILFNKFDSQGMILDDADLRDEAMINFLKDGEKQLKILHETDSNDKDNYVEANLYSFGKVQKKDPDFGDLEGSVWAEYKFDNEKDYAIAKELELQTSLEGFGHLEELEQDLNKEESSLKKFIEKYKVGFSKIFGEERVEKVLNKEDEEMTKEEAKELFGELLEEKVKKAKEDAVVEIIESLSKGDNVELLKSAIEAIQKLVKGEEISEEVKELAKQFDAPEADDVEPIKKENEDLKTKVEELEKELGEQKTPANNINKIKPEDVVVEV